VTTTVSDAIMEKADEQFAEAQAAGELVRLARERDLSLAGPDGLLKSSS
jgi:hypothetical protein